jgi:hypothetical protein
MQTLHPHVTHFGIWSILLRQNHEGERVIAFDWRQMLIFFCLLSLQFSIPFSFWQSYQSRGNSVVGIKSVTSDHRSVGPTDPIAFPVGRRSPSVDVRCWAGTSFELLSRSPVHIRCGGPLERSGTKKERQNSRTCRKSGKTELGARKKKNLLKISTKVIKTRG